MKNDPFIGPRSRLSSARLHLAQLSQLEEGYFNGGAFEWFQQQSNGVWTNGIRQTAELPDAVEHHTWDALQNLRESLDLSMCAAGIRDGVEDLSKTYFVFSSTEEQWTVDAKRKTKASPEYAVAINCAFKPWRDGNPTLYALSKISAVQRHQLVAPTVLTNNGNAIFRGDAEFNGPGPYRFGVHGWNNETRELIVTETGFSIPIPIEGYEFTTFLAFGNVPVVAGKPIIPVLNAIADICQEIIETIDRAGSS